MRWISKFLAWARALALKRLRVASSLEDMDRVFAHSMDVADVIEVAGFALNGDFGEAAGVGGDDRVRLRPWLRVRRGQSSRIPTSAGRGRLRRGFLPSVPVCRRTYIITDIEFAAEAFGVGTFGAITDKQQLRGHFLSDDLEYADDILDSFDLAEIAEACIRILSPLGAMALRKASIGFLWNRRVSTKL